MSTSDFAYITSYPLSFSNLQNEGNTGKFVTNRCFKARLRLMAISRGEVKHIKQIDIYKRNVNGLVRRTNGGDSQENVFLSCTVYGERKQKPLANNTRFHAKIQHESTYPPTNRLLTTREQSLICKDSIQ